MSEKLEQPDFSILSDWFQSNIKLETTQSLPEISPQLRLSLHYACYWLLNSNEELSEYVQEKVATIYYLVALYEFSARRNNDEDLIQIIITLDSIVSKWDGEGTGEISYELPLLDENEEITENCSPTDTVPYDIEDIQQSGKDTFIPPETDFTPIQTIRELEKLQQKVYRNPEKVNIKRELFDATLYFLSNHTVLPEEAFYEMADTLALIYEHTQNKHLKHNLDRLLEKLE